MNTGIGPQVQSPPRAGKMNKFNWDLVLERY